MVFHHLKLKSTIDIYQTRIGDSIHGFPIIKQFEKQFSFLYPDNANYMDPITLVVFIDDVESDKPVTFKCFAYKYFRKRPRGGLQLYADKIYGSEVRRPWESKYNYDKRVHIICEHLNSCTCNADLECNKVQNLTLTYLTLRNNITSYWTVT